MSKILLILRRWRDDRGGAFAILFALVFPVLVLCVGAALDLSTAMLERQRLQQALDAATLALAHTIQDNPGDLEASMRAFLNLNYPGQIDDISVTVDGSRIEATANGTLKTGLLTMATLAIPVVAKSTIVFRMDAIEVVLVVDATNSMQRQLGENTTIMQETKVAAQDFVDRVFDNAPAPDLVKIGMISYGTAVNLGSYALGLFPDGTPGYGDPFVKNPQNRGYRPVDLANLGPDHPLVLEPRNFHGWVHMTGNNTIDTSDPYQDPSTTPLLYDVFLDYEPVGLVSHDHCMKRFVDMSCSGQNSKTPCYKTVLGVRKLETDINKNAVLRGFVDSACTSYGDDMHTLFSNVNFTEPVLPLTGIDDREVVNDAINNLFIRHHGPQSEFLESGKPLSHPALSLPLSDGSYFSNSNSGFSCSKFDTPWSKSGEITSRCFGPIAQTFHTSFWAGMLWGYRVLTPDFPFQEGSSWESKDVRRFLVMFTDGNNTGTPPGIMYKNPLRETTKQEDWDNFQAVCENARDDGIIIYAVVLTFASDESLDAIGEQMKACTGDPTRYFEAQGADGLREAFQAVAQQVLEVRITH